MEGSGLEYWMLTSPVGKPGQLTARKRASLFFGDGIGLLPRPCGFRCQQVNNTWRVKVDLFGYFRDVWGQVREAVLKTPRGMCTSKGAT